MTINFDAESIKSARIAEAEAYVTTRFYPPLPREYGALAIRAVDACNRDENALRLDVTELPVYPKAAFIDGDGHTVIRASDLVEALRLWHLVESEED